MRLKDKVILVTGSTTGIGEAIAKRVIAELPPAPTTTDDERRGQAKAIIDKIPGKHLDALIPTLEVFARSR